MSDETCCSFIRCHESSRLKLMQLKDVEKHASVGDALKHVLEVYESKPIVHLLMGTTEIYVGAV